MLSRKTVFSEGARQLGSHGSTRRPRRSLRVEARQLESDRIARWARWEFGISGNSGRSGNPRLRTNLLAFPATRLPIDQEGHGSLVTHQDLLLHLDRPGRSATRIGVPSTCGILGACSVNSTAVDDAEALRCARLCGGNIRRGCSHDDGQSCRKGLFASDLHGWLPPIRNCRSRVCCAPLKSALPPELSPRSARSGWPD